MVWTFTIMVRTGRSGHLINRVVPSCPSKVLCKLASASSSGPNTCTLLGQLGGLGSIAATCTSKKTKKNFPADVALGWVTGSYIIRLRVIYYKTESIYTANDSLGFGEKK